MSAPGARFTGTRHATCNWTRCDRKPRLLGTDSWEELGADRANRQEGTGKRNDNSGRVHQCTSSSWFDLSTPDQRTIISAACKGTFDGFFETASRQQHVQNVQ